MLTVLKITIANIKQKKFRSALIIISIVLSVALIYTVLSLSDSTQKIFENKVKKEVGSANYMITPKENSGLKYVPETDFSGINGVEYSVPLVTAVGYSKIDGDMVPITLTGMNYKDYQTVYNSESFSKYI